jgi:hypothetical protein
LLAAGVEEQRTSSWRDARRYLELCLLAGNFGREGLAPDCALRQPFNHNHLGTWLPWAATNNLVLPRFRVLWIPEDDMRERYSAQRCFRSGRIPSSLPVRSKPLARESCLNMNPEPTQHSPKDMKVLRSPGMHHQEKSKDCCERASEKNEDISPSLRWPADKGSHARRYQNKVSRPSYWSDDKFGMRIVTCVDEMKENRPPRLDEGGDEQICYVPESSDAYTSTVSS